MSHIDLHPDELFDALRAGRLDAAGEHRLRDHCVRCEACAMELRWAEAGLHEARPDARDEARAQRALAALLGEANVAQGAGGAGQPAKAPEAAAESIGPKRSARRWQLALAGVLLMLSGSSAAALWTGQPLVVHLRRLVEAVGLELRPTERVSPRAPRPTPTRPHAEKPSAAAARPRITAPPSVPSTPVEVPPPVAAEAAVAVPEPKPRVASAEQMMARAARLRARGDSASAADTYDRVIQRYPRSRHAQSARVAMGNLHLHRLRDAAAAQRAFTDYLELAPQGPLSEEALSGLALAYRRMGTGAQEAQAWQRLLSAHPTSPYASTARRRLVELSEGGQGAP